MSWRAAIGLFCGGPGAKHTTLLPRNKEEELPYYCWTRKDIRMLRQRDKDMRRNYAYLSVRPLIILVFLTYAIIDLHELIKNPILTGVNYEYYTPRAENTKKYDILTNDFTLAYLVDHTHFSETKMTSDEINTYLRVTFYKNFKAVPASLCRDKYAEQISQGSSFLDD